ncbi:sulfotransferase [Palleronia sediminis]|uniref:Sulfotransferase n=1 Tax=Palleronia sediminis TaxID=2547833 RepID=A0A4R6A7N0_9RHOB|nr:sulfotransferase [Palleronia sediminis]TDL79771.1 sulfotransferase [Palleronia sediminis]
MPPHRYVFVGGLHRSGTSLVARMIAALPGVAAIRDAPVPENEGVYLQGAIPHTRRHGAPMRFATDPAQHLVEGCPYDTQATRDRIEADWAPWFGPGAWRVEKSPVNLTRTRLYQQLFPTAQFVLVLRHPQAVAAAVAKWVDDPAPAMLDHWIAAHEIVAGDLPYLHAALVLRYEDIVADPNRAAAQLAAFLDRPAPAPPDEAVIDGNAAYAPPCPLGPARAARLAQWGYGEGMRALPQPVQVAHPLNAVAQAVRAAG